MVGLSRTKARAPPPPNLNLESIRARHQDAVREELEATPSCTTPGSCPTTTVPPATLPSTTTTLITSSATTDTTRPPTPIVTVTVDGLTMIKETTLRPTTPVITVTESGLTIIKETTPPAPTGPSTLTVTVTRSLPVTSADSTGVAQVSTGSETTASATTSSITSVASLPQDTNTAPASDIDPPLVASSAVAAASSSTSPSGGVVSGPGLTLIGVAGTLAGTSLLGILGFFIFRWRRKKKDKIREKESSVGDFGEVSYRK